MKKILVISLFTILLLFLTSCSNEFVCNSPYIQVGSECCLDSNNNSICDEDDYSNNVTEENRLEEQTVESNKTINKSKNISLEELNTTVKPEENIKSLPSQELSEEEESENAKELVENLKGTWNNVGRIIAEYNLIYGRDHHKLYDLFSQDFKETLTRPVYAYLFYIKGKNRNLHKKRLEATYPFNYENMEYNNLYKFKDKNEYTVNIEFIYDEQIGNLLIDDAMTYTTLIKVDNEWKLKPFSDFDISIKDACSGDYNNDCYYIVAYKLKDSSFCSKIKNDDKESLCLNFESEEYLNSIINIGYIDYSEAKGKPKLIEKKAYLFWSLWNSEDYDLLYNEFTSDIEDIFTKDEFITFMSVFGKYHDIVTLANVGGTNLLSERVDIKIIDISYNEISEFWYTTAEWDEENENWLINATNTFNLGNYENYCKYVMGDVNKKSCRRDLRKIQP